MCSSDWFYFHEKQFNGSFLILYLKEVIDCYLKINTRKNMVKKSYNKCCFDNYLNRRRSPYLRNHDTQVTVTWK